MHIHICICMYVCIHMYTYIHTYICLYEADRYGRAEPPRRLDATRVRQIRHDPQRQPPQHLLHVSGFASSGPASRRSGRRGLTNVEVGGGLE